MKLELEALRPRIVTLYARSTAGSLTADGFPPIVCVCGSTRNYEEIEELAKELTLAGVIVVRPEVVTSYPGQKLEDQAVKKALDALHFRKIELADAIVVVNLGGYVGESTAAEIAYATHKGKPIHYLESVPTQEESFLDDADVPPSEGSFPVLTPESRLRLNLALDGRSGERI